jgi:GTP-binding protein Era
MRRVPARGAVANASILFVPALGLSQARHRKARHRCAYNPRMSETPFRAGQVAVIGRPNVGKSTLVNALVGAKVSITSSRPQTTRHRLLGIATFPQGQLLLVDTPGIHREQGKSSASAMHRWMNRAARGAVEGVDAAALVIEAGRWDEEDALAYETLRAAGVPVVLVVNQVDRIKDKAALLPFLAQVSEGREFAAVHPVSALKRKGLESLVDDLLRLVPEQPAVYAEDEITDKSQRFLAGELVREQLMRQLGAELPYATTVEIERFEVDGAMLRIGAVVWVERDGQKAIVIGKGGSRLREIGTRAREQMERLFGAKVFLETWVRVRAGWSDDEAALRAFGYYD